MDKSLRIVIIGGSACGPKAAARARRLSSNAKITILEQGQYVSIATCGLPYFNSGVIKSENSVIVQRPDYFKKVMDIDVLIGMRVLSINRKAYTLQVLNLKTNINEVFKYDKLVISTGATPKSLPIPGRELKNVFTLNKLEDVKAIKSTLISNSYKKAVIVGAGLIGMEMAEAFTVSGLQTTVVESLDWPLSTMLDQEMAVHVEKHLRDKGVNLVLGKKVQALEGSTDGYVKRVVLQDQAIEADIVLLAVGTTPNVKLAREAGLTIGSLGGLIVNKYMETNDSDIYAGGDCVENTNLVNGTNIFAPLGSTANKHGRVIGTNITGGRETFPGVMGTFVVKIFDYNVARTGLTERQLVDKNEVVTALIPAPDRASYYPGNKEIMLKVIADRASRRILGAQAIGQGETAKRIDVIATAMTFGATVDTLANIDLAYAPPYNTALDPVHSAANVIKNKISGRVKTLTCSQVKEKLDRGEKFILLDVRYPVECNLLRIECPQVVYIPLPELRQKLNTLPKDDQIVIICKSSVRAYQAQCILQGSGFKDVWFMDGSIAAWPYEVFNAKVQKRVGL
ncbi:MAG: FAD-dependent oxidoreductase [Chloroflexi bacterium]|nr:FAD-dependent oxidoreductase [Chloroflexota bacterium]